MDPFSASLIVPSYNGKDLLARYLPSVLRAARTGARQHEVLVVDDGSTDGTLDLVQRSFPTVRLIAEKPNGGFIKACNTGADLSSHDIVVFLNNDVEVDIGFLEPLLRHFHDPSLFSVSPKMLRGADCLNESVTRGFARFGFLMVDFPAVRRTDSRFEHTMPIMYGCGGAVAVHKRKFMQMGGFDELYLPNYSEDRDAGYRAWKRGWKVLYEPRSVVYHQHSATMNRVLSKNARSLLAWRNHLLFMWKNLSDKELLAKHAMLLFPFTLYRLIIRRDYMFPLAVLHACARLPQVLRSRRQERVHWLLSDRQVLSLSDCFSPRSAG